MIRLNCDMGESFAAWTMGNDAAVMPHIQMASIACGFHAGDPAIMQRTVRLAREHQVLIGAHPSYPDLAGFGRRSLRFPKAELQAILHYQIGALAAIARSEGMALSYVKPHGALYNDMQKDQDLFDTVLQVVAQYTDADGCPLPLVTLAQPAPEWLALAGLNGVPLWFEAFADRRYEANGQLRSRQHADAVLHDRQAILEQALRFAHGEPIIAVNGEPLLIQADTLCVHGDNAESVATVAAIAAAIGNPVQRP